MPLTLQRIATLTGYVLLRRNGCAAKAISHQAYAVRRELRLAYGQEILTLLQRYHVCGAVGIVAGRGGHRLAHLEKIRP